MIYPSAFQSWSWGDGLEVFGFVFEITWAAQVPVSDAGALGTVASALGHKTQRAPGSSYSNTQKFIFASLGLSHQPGTNTSWGVMWLFPFLAQWRNNKPEDSGHSLEPAQVKGLIPQLTKPQVCWALKGQEAH